MSTLSSVSINENKFETNGAQELETKSLKQRHARVRNKEFETKARKS